MTNKVELSWGDCQQLAQSVAAKIDLYWKEKRFVTPIRCFTVPQGGIYAGLLVQASLQQKFKRKMTITTTPDDADIFLDDLIDSGDTAKRFQGDRPFFCLLNKAEEGLMGEWIIFPWEATTDPTRPPEIGPFDAVVRILQYIGEDPTREGLRETPQRVIKSYSEIFRGYNENPEDHLKVFTDGACDEMVILRDIEFYSCCEHHMQPFFGSASIGYIPDRRVVGVSKIARILDTFARRLQIQERLTTQVTGALMEHLKPKGAACVIEAKHFCMVCRGVNKQNSTMITSSMEGVLRTDASARAEFLRLIK